MALDSFENRKWKFTKHGMQLKGGETRVRRREPCKHEAVIARGYKGKTKRQGKASFECGGQKGEVIHYHTLLLVGGGGIFSFNRETEYRKCGTFTQWSTTQLLKTMTS
jgi:hypothetical protein